MPQLAQYVPTLRRAALVLLEVSTLYAALTLFVLFGWNAGPAHQFGMSQMTLLEAAGYAALCHVCRYVFANRASNTRCQ